MFTRIGKARTRLGAAAVLVAVAFSPLGAGAAGTSSVAVSATVSNVCAFGGSTPTTVTFAGGYDPVVANASAAATASYSPQYMCTKSDSTYTWSFTRLNHALTKAVPRRGSTPL